MVAWIERVQKRVAATAGFLNDIKAVKMLGLSDALYNITTKLREDELHASSKFRKLLVLQILTGEYCNTPCCCIKLTVRFRKRSHSFGTVCYLRCLRSYRKS